MLIVIRHAFSVVIDTTVKPTLLTFNVTEVDILSTILTVTIDFINVDSSYNFQFSLLLR